MRAKVELLETQSERLKTELAEARQRPDDGPEVARLQDKLAAANRKAELLAGELEKLRAELADRPSGIQHEVIRIPIATKRQEALEAAMAHFAKMYPSSGAVETIEEFARQIESGLVRTSAPEPVTNSQGE